MEVSEGGWVNVMVVVLSSLLVWTGVSAVQVMVVEKVPRAELRTERAGYVAEAVETEDAETEAVDESVSRRVVTVVV